MGVSEDLREYRNEVNIATSSYYAWKSLNSVAASADGYLRALNRNALTWNIALHSLQVTFFIALGRIFDNDKRALTAATFIRKCKENIGEFTREALEKRRLMESKGVRPEWLTAYVANAYEAAPADFDRVSASIETYRGIYDARYKPIRHKFMAHKEYASINLKDSLFANTSTAEIEDIIRFLDGVEAFVVQLHANGRLIDVSDHRPDLEGRYVKDAKGLLDLLVGEAS